GRLEIHHVVLEARRHHFVLLEALVGEAFPGVGAQTVQGQRLDALGPFLVRGRHHATLARDDVLGHVEAERTQVAERAGVAAVVERFDGVGTVLDYLQAVSVGEVADRLHVAGPAGEVDGEDRPRPRRDPLSGVFDVEAHRLAVHVTQYRPAAGVD